MGRPISAEDWEWKVKDAANALTQAQELKKDKKLYAAAIKELQNRQKAVGQALAANNVGKAFMSKGK